MSVVGIVVLAAVLAAATAYGVVRRRRSGVLRTPDDPAAARLSAADLGQPLGERVTLVQFSSAFCRPCVATRHVLGRAAADLPGVAHVEVDAESHLALVRRLGVASTPTTLVLDPAGVERRRATGVPRRDDVLAAVAEVCGRASGASGRLG
jgi:thiol-disulfide isomerase/thioredoxin